MVPPGTTCTALAAKLDLIPFVGSGIRGMSFPISYSGFYYILCNTRDETSLMTVSFLTLESVRSQFWRRADGTIFSTEKGLG